MKEKDFRGISAVSGKCLLRMVKAIIQVIVDEVLDF